PDRSSVPYHLGRRLVQRHHEGALASARAFGEVLQPHDALADWGYADHEDGGAWPHPAAKKRIEARNAGRDPSRYVVGGSLLSLYAAGRLDAAVHVDATTILDAKRVAAQLEIVAARFEDLERACRGPVEALEP